MISGCGPGAFWTLALSAPSKSGDVLGGGGPWRTRVANSCHANLAYDQSPN